MGYLDTWMVEYGGIDAPIRVRLPWDDVPWPSNWVKDARMRERWDQMEPWRMSFRVIGCHIDAWRMPWCHDRDMMTPSWEHEEPSGDMRRHSKPCPDDDGAKWRDRHPWRWRECSNMPGRCQYEGDIPSEWMKGCHDTLEWMIWCSNMPGRCQGDANMMQWCSKMEVGYHEDGEIYLQMDDTWVMMGRYTPQWVK